MMMVLVTTIISIFQVYKSRVCSQAGESLNELFRERREVEGEREKKSKRKRERQRQREQRDRETESRRLQAARNTP